MSSARNRRHPPNCARSRAIFKHRPRSCDDLLTRRETKTGHPATCRFTFRIRGREGVSSGCEPLGNHSNLDFRMPPCFAFSYFLNTCTYTRHRTHSRSLKSGQTSDSSRRTACNRPCMDTDRFGVQQVWRFVEGESEGVSHRVLLDVALCLAKRPGWMVDFAAVDVAFLIGAVKTIARAP